MPDQLVKPARELKIKTLTSLGPKVKLDDLNEDLNLLSKNQIAVMHLILDKEDNGRFSKPELKKKIRDFVQQERNNPHSTFSSRHLDEIASTEVPYGMIKSGKNIFAVYRGVKQGHGLGEGGFGATKLVMNIDKATWSVAKIIQMRALADKGYGPAMMNPIIDQEINNLRSLNKLEFECNFTSRKGAERIIGMELAKGKDLEKAFDEHNKKTAQAFSPAQILLIAKNSTKEIEKLHAKKMLHRDIKPANFMVQQGSCDVTLIDYGLADKKKNLKGAGAAGTPDFIAPEILFEYGSEATAMRYSNESDVYALGMYFADIYGLLRSKPSDRDVTEIVPEDDPQFLNNDKLPKDPESKKELFRLIKQMTAFVPSDRPSASEVNKRLNKIIAKDANNLATKVVVINVNDFLKLSPDTQDLLMQQMKQEGINAIALGDTMLNRQDKEYFQLIQLLEKNGLTHVTNQLITGTREQQTLGAYNYFKQKLSGNLRVYRVDENGLEEAKDIQIQAKAKSRSFFKIPKFEKPSFHLPWKKRQPANDVPMASTQPAQGARIVTPPEDRQANQEPSRVWEPAMPNKSSFFSEKPPTQNITEQQLIDALNYLNKHAEEKNTLGIKPNFLINKIQPLNGGKQFMILAQSPYQGEKDVKVTIPANKIAEYAHNEAELGRKQQIKVGK